jgi:MEMO1 family protein
MSLRNRPVLIVGLLLVLCGCQRQDIAAAAKQNSGKVIRPAVAGLFYPKHPTSLAKDVDKLLADAKSEPVRNLRALVCPHAGYEFSGKTAAIGYKQLAGRQPRTVIVMGPSHTAIFRGAAVADAETVETPLGAIPVSPKAAELGKLAPFAQNPPCQVQRPQWWQASPKELPPFGQETPFTWEHSVEVQLPFLQRVLKDFKVVPVVFGEVAPEQAASALLKVIDDDTLLVASSDLTHYLPYDVAKSFDTTTVRAISSANVEWLEEEDAMLRARSQGQVSVACGKDPILTVMYIARQKGWKAKLLDYRNSGDTAGGKQAVVGYAAIAFYAPAGGTADKAEKSAGNADLYTTAERKCLLDLARRSLVAAANRQPAPELDKTLPEKLAEPRACFVTLNKQHKLRGCIGSVFPTEPLAQAVVNMARSAAIEDHRFSVVKPEELKEIQVEVSVLTLPQRLAHNSAAEVLAGLRPGVDGVVLRVGTHQGIFLPQVWEHFRGRDGFQKEAFLNELAEQKAGIEAAAWKRSDARILTFQVEAFEEAK